jgi:subtilisin family serine protease
VSPLPTDPFIGTPEQGVSRDPLTQHQPQWYLHRTSVLEAWGLGARGAGVVIAAIDWGFLTSHPELAPRLDMRKAYNAIDHDDAVDEGTYIGHGTAVLGLAGAAGDGAGMAGYAPEASLWPIQAAIGGRAGADGGWHDAIMHVTGEDSGGRRKVIIVEAQTGALGNCEQIPSTHAAIRWAIAHGVVVCVPAGNGGKPADLADDGATHFDRTGSILVGATSWDAVVNRPWVDSNWGPALVVSAPGDPEHDVTCWDDGYHTDGFGGTSGAAAKVAGVAALMLSVNPTLSPGHIREILHLTGTPIQTDPQAPEKQAGVFLDAAAAVREALRRPGARKAEAAPPTLGTAV